MKQRCLNPNHSVYSYYGGKGIKVFEDWINDFKEFEKWILENLRQKPEGTTLDRINSNEDYVPGNIRWSSYSIQNTNKGNIILYPFQGEELTLYEISKD